MAKMELLPVLSVTSSWAVLTSLRTGWLHQMTLACSMTSSLPSTSSKMAFLGTSWQRTGRSCVWCSRQACSCSTPQCRSQLLQNCMWWQSMCRSGWRHTEEPWVRTLNSQWRQVMEGSLYSGSLTRSEMRKVLPSWRMDFLQVSNSMQITLMDFELTRYHTC